MASQQAIILITGANGGIGFELASQLIEDANKHVIVGSRSPAKGAEAIAQLQALQRPGTVELVELDVDSPSSIDAAAKTVTEKHGRLDALVNNAAVAWWPNTMPVHEKMERSFRTNAIGPYLTVNAFAPLLAKSTGTPRVINVSTEGSSIAYRLDASGPFYKVSGYDYRASKAALNMVTACQIVELGDSIGAKVFAYNPGFVVSNLGPFNKPEKGAQPTSVGAAPMVNLLNGERDAEHGTFIERTGQRPW